MGLAHYRLRREVLQDMPGWQLLGREALVCLQAGPHDQGQFPVLLHGLRRKQGQGHQERKGSRDPPDSAQKRRGPVRLQRLGSFQRQAGTAVLDYHSEGPPNQQRCRYQVQEGQAGPLHQHAPLLRGLEAAEGRREVDGHVLGRQGGCTHCVPARKPAKPLGLQDGHHHRCLFPELQGGLGGLFGNLEVSSAEGFKRFLEQFEKAYSGGCWKQETEACKAGWKYGAWGEDLFMQRTMDDAEVAKIDDFDLTTSGTCPGDRPAGQKTTSCTCPPAKLVRHWLLSILSVTSKAGSSASARSPASSMLRNEGLKYLLRFRGDCGSD